MRIRDWSSDVCSSDLQLVSAATDTIDDEAVADLHRGEPAGPGGEDKQRARELPDAPQLLRRGAPQGGLSGVEDSGEQIGRAVCREQECQYVEHSVGAE